MLACAGQYVPIKVELPTAPAAATELRQQVCAVLLCSILCCCLGKLRDQAHEFEQAAFSGCGSAQSLRDVALSVLPPGCSMRDVLGSSTNTATTRAC